MTNWFRVGLLSPSSVALITTVDNGGLSAVVGYEKSSCDVSWTRRMIPVKAIPYGGVVTPVK